MDGSGGGSGGDGDGGSGGSGSSSSGGRSSGGGGGGLFRQACFAIMLACCVAFIRYFHMRITAFDETLVAEALLITARVRLSS